VEKRPILRAANLGSDYGMIDETAGDEIEIGDGQGIGELDRAKIVAIR